MIPLSSFFADIIDRNRLSGDFVHWCWHPGMRFQETAAWWRSKARQTPHEGLDLLFFEDLQGRERSLPESALVPAPLDGELAAIVPDFLGHTLVLAHPLRDARGWRLHAILAHVVPNLALGTKVAEGEAIARLAPIVDTARPDAPPAHLHLSLAWFHPELVPADFTWRNLWRNDRVRLIDPIVLADSGRSQPRCRATRVATP